MTIRLITAQSIVRIQSVLVKRSPQYPVEKGCQTNRTGLSRGTARTPISLVSCQANVVSVLNLAAASTVPGWGAATLTALTKIVLFRSLKQLVNSRHLKLSADIQSDF